MATNILKIFNKITNSWESVSGVGLGADPSSTTGTVDLTNYYKKNETYSKNEIDTKVASAGNFDASQYYLKTEVYSKSEVDTKVAASGTFDASQYYNKSDIDSKITSIPTFNASLYYPKTDTYSKDEIDEKIGAITPFNASQYYNKSEVDSKANFVHQNAIDVSSELITQNVKEINKKIAGLLTKESVYTKAQIDAKIPNLSEYVKNNYTATDLQLNTNVKIKGTLQKDNSEVGDPDEDYITTKYFGENFPVFFDQKINTIADGSVDNFVLKNQKYTSPAYTFTEKTNEVSLAIIDNFKQFNNFVITFTDTPNKLVLSGPQNGQSGVIKVINAKKINGYDSNLKSTYTLPVLDKLNDTEYFSYYVFSESEILFSRI